MSTSAVKIVLGAAGNLGDTLLLVRSCDLFEMKRARKKKRLKLGRVIVVEQSVTQNDWIPE